MFVFHDPDSIFCNHGVPVLNGVQCLARTQEVMKHRPIIFRPHPADEDRLTRRDINVREKVVETPPSALPSALPPWADEDTIEEGDRTNGLWLGEVK